MKDLLSIMTFGHHVQSGGWSFLIVFMVYASFLMQFLVIYYDYKIIWRTRHIEWWTVSQIFLFTTMIMALFRRYSSVRTNFDMMDAHDGGFDVRFFVDAIWMLLMSGGWLASISCKKKFLDKFFKIGRHNDTLADG